MRNINGNSPLDLINTDKNDSTADMYWDVETHQLYTTDKGFKKLVGISPASLEDTDFEADIVRNLISDMVQTYMYESVYTGDIPAVEFRITRDRDLQRVISKCHGYLLLSDDLNGMMHNYLLHGLDMGISQEDINAVVMPKLVVDTLKNAKLLKKRITFRVTDDVYRKGY